VYKFSADSTWPVAGSIAADVVTASERVLLAGTAFDFRVTYTGDERSDSSHAVLLTMLPQAPLRLLATSTSSGTARPSASPKR